MVEISWDRLHSKTNKYKINCFTYLAYQISIKNWAGLLEILVILSNFFSFLKYKKSDNIGRNDIFGIYKIGLYESQLYQQKKAPQKVLIINGAISKNRTCDPVITNDVLYH